MSSVTIQYRFLLLRQMDSNITRTGGDGAHKDIFYVACDRAVQGVGLRPLAYWGYGFESCREHGYLSLVGVVFCQAEVSVPGLSLVQRSPTECGVSECDREASIMMRSWHARGCCVMGEGNSVTM